MQAAIPTHIEPLLIRHAEDAAFYWAQLDSATGAFNLHPERHAHFNRLLDAHLEGLLVAEEHGVAPALKALARWGQPGEAFVAAWLGLQCKHRDEAAIDAVLAHIAAAPESLMRGLISAVAWLPAAAQSGALAYLMQCGEIGQVAALRAAALIGTTPGGVDPFGDLAPILDDPCAQASPRVRAAACRALAAMAIRVWGDGRAHQRTTGPLSGLVAAWESTWVDGLQPTLDRSPPGLLRRLLEDSDVSVRAEAAIGLARLDARAGTHANLLDARHALHAALLQQLAEVQRCSGIGRQLAMRRLLRWVACLALLTPPGSPDTESILHDLPARTALTFLLHHGDLAQLPRIAGWMQDPLLARHAGWVWQTLTGIDLEAHGYVIESDEAGVDTQPDDAAHTDSTDPAALQDARRDADNGLPYPDVMRIAAHPVSPAAVAEPHLLGRPTSREWLCNIVDGDHPHAVRAAAAHRLMLLTPVSATRVKGPVFAGPLS
ncbi:hypothetical protein N8I74_10110 [Chitiniphilus purpureus]|uniref:HEAT repeat domain-containing protein n=1 Tax=Chitiniphilus purpureus TaxID=2981137 RepID=A0ABY6DH86_9NEIS|nr:hypothetical protein [Chitiniphilus sp. CD1]UXY13677.1 hypothetical protein N8I74_10110 [Chitiniphilus sp. CD1]